MAGGPGSVRRLGHCLIGLLDARGELAGAETLRVYRSLAGLGSGYREW
ncbi:hypothetical protein EMIT051CA3_60178 [Pseudomonas chlororaphis]